VLRQYTQFAVSTWRYQKFNVLAENLFLRSYDFQSLGFLRHTAHSPLLTG
jgi:hypothetical protein